MNVVRLKPRPPRRDIVTPALALLAIGAVCALGWVAANRFMPESNSVSTAPAAQAGERRVQFGMCGRDRNTCVVDGDTIWLDGVNLRLQSYDTPEPYSQICGGDAEVTLANRASARLLQLLNQNPFTVETFGLDITGERRLATVRVNGRDLGDILIEEKLARRWPDGEEFWC